MRLLILIAAGLLFGLAVGIALLRANDWQDVKDVLSIMLPTLTLFLGVGVGLYFGRRSA